METLAWGSSDTTIGSLHSSTKSNKLRVHLVDWVDMICPKSFSFLHFVLHVNLFFKI